MACDNKNIITASDFIKLHHQNDESNLQASMIFLGQGIIKSQLTILTNFFIKNNIAYTSCIGKNTIEDKKFVHKRKAKNVVITKPVLLSKFEFIGFLYVADNCEILDDHVTGLHLQGMLIVEAARQMMISIVENFFLGDSDKFRKRFTLVNIKSEFNSFLFPITVEIKANLKNFTNNNGNLISEINCAFIQNNIICANVHISFRVHNEKSLLRKENISAKTIFDLITKIT